MEALAVKLKLAETVERTSALLEVGLDALVAYLQVLGRMVDFTTYNPQLNLR